MGKFRDKMTRFLYGRNGADALYRATGWFCLFLLLINLFVRQWWLFIVLLVLSVWSTFRFFSRNIYRRQKENQAFLRRFKAVGGWFRLSRDRFRDRKTHIYRKCPSCHRILRLPRIKGAHTVNCPCCHNRFEMKV